jgi:O-antigen/teichoic acid export membrane protein
VLSNILSILKSENLRGKFARGGVVLTLGSACDIGARFIRNIILARLLAKEYFGLMATILSAVALFEAVTEVGAKHAVIQSKRGGSHEFLNVTWWFSAIRGVGLYAFAFLLAPLICDFYEEPSLLVPIRTAYTALFLLGIASPRIHALEKELSYLKLVILRQGSGIVGVVVAIVMSFFFKNIWPLVAGYVIEFFGMCVLSFVFVPFRPRPKIDRECLRELTKFARGMLGLPVLTSLFFQFDIIVIGKFISMEACGPYAMARSFALMPVLAFSKILRPLVLPAFSKLQNDVGALKKAILNIIDLTVAGSAPFVAYCIVFGRPLLAVLYGEEFATVHVSFSIIMFYVLVRLISGILMQVFLVFARPDLQRSFSIVRLIVVGVIFYPALLLFGMPGVAFTVLAGMASCVLLQMIWAGKLVDLDTRHFYRRFLRGGVFSLFVIVPGVALRCMVQWPDFVLVAVGAIFCLAAWLAVLKSPHYRGLVLGERA